VVKAIVVDMTRALPKPTLTSHPVDVGHRAEAAVLAELVKRGYRVLLPFGVNQRYDMVLDCGGRFLRAQCKTGRLREGVIQCSTQSIQSNRRGTRWRSYTGEIDLFVVYCPQNDSVYVVPADEVPDRAMHLRLDAPRNRQDKRVRWAKDYELPA
jgi:Holliday junction resolvase-like predicted endonuclease